MAREFSKSFYNSAAWKKCRKAFIAYRVTVDAGICEKCKETPGYIVDHMEELTPENINNPDITLNPDNFQYLCLECHNKKTFGKKREVLREGLMFDSNGDLIQLPP